MMQGAELVSVITAAAVGISQGRTTEELETLAVVFTQLGETLATLAVQGERQKECCSTQKRKR